MSSRKFHFHDGESGAAVAVKLVLKGKKTTLRKVKKDGTLVIHVPRSASDLNRALVDFFSNVVGISGSKIQIVAGRDRSEKLISFLEQKPEIIQKKILKLVD